MHDEKTWPSGQKKGIWIPALRCSLDHKLVTPPAGIEAPVKSAIFFHNDFYLGKIVTYK